MLRMIKRINAGIAFFNKFEEPRALPYWAKLLWVLLDMNDDKILQEKTYDSYSNRHWKITEKIRKWFFKSYLDGKVSE